MSARYGFELPPILLLRRNVGRGWNPDVRADEEEGENIAMARFSGIAELESLDAMLKDIWEHDQSALFRENMPEILHSIRLAALTSKSSSILA